MSEPPESAGQRITRRRLLAGAAGLGAAALLGSARHASGASELRWSNRPLSSEARGGPRVAIISAPGVDDYISASTNGSALETTGSGSGPIGMPPSAMRRSGTMSKGGLGGRSVARMDALSWLQNVRVGPGSQQHRSSSSGPGSSSTRSSTGQESNPPSRLGSRSRPTSGSDRRKTSSRQTSDTYDDDEHRGFIEEKSKDPEKDKGRSRRSSSLSRTGTDDKKEDSSQSLQDEYALILPP